MAKTVEASLNPADFASGGAVPDGRYVIKAAQAVEFDYGGTADAVPALAIVYSDGHNDVEQNYSAGKAEHLTPTSDGSAFEHPNGEVPKIGKNSNMGLFIKAILDAGFPPNELGSKVTCFLGADVDIVNQAQPKRPGLKDQVEGKTIPLPSKYYGKVKAGSWSQGPGKGRPAASAKTSPKPSAQSTASNGDTDDEAAVGFIQAALEGEEGVTLATLGTKVWKGIMKGKDNDAKKLASDYKKLALNAEWLEEHSEEGGWVTDGETVSLG